jgi:phage-related protein
MAILDLHNKLQAAGVTGTKVGALLTDAFTKRSSAPLAILLGELGQFESKYPELKKGATSFGDSWKHTSELISTKAKEAKANIEAAFIGLGHMLQPIAGKILDMFNHAFSWAQHHKKTMQELAKVIKTVLVGALIIAGVVLGEMAIEAAIAAAPFILLAAAIGYAVKWFIHLYEHNAKVREFTQNLVKEFKHDAVEAVHWLMHAFQEAKKVISEVIDAVVGFYEKHKKAINGMVNDVVKVLKDVGQAFQDGFDAVKAIVMTVVKVVEELWKRFGQHLWQHIVTAWHAIVQVVRGALQVVKGIFEVITGILTGHWSKFWKGICNIVDGAWNIVSGIVKAGVNFISTIIGAATALISAEWKLIWHTIETLAKNAWDGIKHVLHLIYDVFIQLPWNILKAIGNAAMALFHVGENFILGLLKGIGSQIAKLWDWAQRLPQDMFNVLDGIYDWMLTVGENIITGIWNGIAKMADWLWKKVKGFLSGLWGDIKGFLGIGSPSRLMADTVGKHISTGIAAGILENRHHVHAALKRVADDVAKAQMNAGGFTYGSQANNSGVYGTVGHGGTVNIYHVTVQGQVVDTQGFFRAMQTAAQQHGSRNSKTGLTFVR